MCEKSAKYPHTPVNQESKKFYNSDTPEAITYLEFGSHNPQTQTNSVWDRREHQEAYDFFMVARYLKDLIVLRELTRNSQTLSPDEQLENFGEEIFTKDLYNSFSKLAALAVTKSLKGPEPVGFVELGSTLMGCIEGMEFIQRLGRRFYREYSTLNLKDVIYYGVDISDFLNKVAKELHPEHQVIPYTSLSLLPKNLDVFFAKGVSLLYACKGARELVEAVTTARVSLFDYSFSLANEQLEILGTGKQVAFTPIKEFLSSLKELSPTSQLMIQKSTALIDREKQRLRGVFVLGAKDTVATVVAEELRLKRELYKLLTSRSSRAVIFYNQLETPLEPDFVPCEEFIREL